MRISNYNKPIIDKLLELDYIYKADLKFVTFSRQGWDCDSLKWTKTLEATNEKELERIITKTIKENNISRDGDFGISLSGISCEVVKRYKTQQSILD